MSCQMLIIMNIEYCVVFSILTTLAYPRFTVLSTYPHLSSASFHAYILQASLHIFKIGSGFYKFWGPCPSPSPGFTICLHQQQSSLLSWSGKQQWWHVKTALAINEGRFSTRLSPPVCVCEFYVFAEFCFAVFNLHWLSLTAECLNILLCPVWDSARLPLFLLQRRTPAAQTDRREKHHCFAEALRAKMIRYSVWCFTDMPQESTRLSSSQLVTSSCLSRIAPSVLLSRDLLVYSLKQSGIWAKGLIK